MLVVSGELRAVTPRLGEWLRQVPQTTSGIYLLRNIFVVLEEPSLKVTHEWGANHHSYPYQIGLNVTGSDLIQYHPCGFLNICYLFMSDKGPSGW